MALEAARALTTEAVLTVNWAYPSGLKGNGGLHAALGADGLVALPSEAAFAPTLRASGRAAAVTSLGFVCKTS